MQNNNNITAKETKTISPCIERVYTTLSKRKQQQKCCIDVFVKGSLLLFVGTIISGFSFVLLICLQNIGIYYFW